MINEEHSSCILFQLFIYDPSCSEFLYENKLPFCIEFYLNHDTLLPIAKLQWLMVLWYSFVSKTCPITVNCVLINGEFLAKILTVSEIVQLGLIADCVIK